jgi:hypothetical protein
MRVVDLIVHGEQLMVGVVTPHTAPGPEVELAALSRGRVVTLIARTRTPPYASGRPPQPFASGVAGLRALSMPAVLDLATANFRNRSIDVIAHASTTSSYVLASDGLNDAELDRRVSRFQGALRQLRDDPAEAARIDALVMDTELAPPDIEARTGRGDIFVTGDHITITSEYPAEAAESKGRFDAALASLEQQLQELTESLKERPTRTRPQPRPPRIWETLLRPAFGSGILVAVLGIATVTAAIHASAAMSIIGIILATATAVTALLSVLVPWTSVHALNRRGAPDSALELLWERNRAEPNAPLPGVRDEIIAARVRVEREWVRKWEEDQMRRIAEGHPVALGEIDDDARGARSAPPSAAFRERKAQRDRGHQGL